MSRVLVTGANGFVGQAVCRGLPTHGLAVRAAVREVPTAHGGSLGATTEQTTEHVAVGEIGPTTDWSHALTQVDTIIHLAGRAHVMHDPGDDPLALYRQVNVAGTVRLARQAAAAGVRRLVFISSVKVNGERTTDRPFTAADLPQPLDPYGQSKWEAEQALGPIARESSLEIVIIRPPLIYGPGVKANFYQLLRAVDRGIPLPFGGIHNRRSLLFLDNLVDAIVCCSTHPQAAGQTFLLSDGPSVSTPELIRGLATALDRPARLLPVSADVLKLVGRLTGRGPALERLVGSLEVDNRHIADTLGWHPPFGFAHGLLQTANWYRVATARG